MLPFIYRIILLFSLLIAFSSSIYAATEPAGYVVVVSGTVTAQAADGTSRTLARRSPIYDGETILTGANRVQIRFADGTLTSLRPGTEFKIESFAWSGQEDGSEKGFFSLLKGGLRTLTGSIGKANQDNYKMATPVATIGIRGTFYRLRLCDGDCGVENQTGLFGGVAEGRINVSNAAGNQNFSAGGFFQVSGPNALPKELLEPPAFFNESDEADPDSDEDEEEREDRKKDKDQDEDEEEREDRKKDKDRDDEDGREGKKDRDDDREADDQERNDDRDDSQEDRDDREDRDNQSENEDWEEWDDRNDQDDRDEDRDNRRGPDDDRDDRRGPPRGPDNDDDREDRDDPREEDDWDDPEYQHQEDFDDDPPPLPGDSGGSAPSNQPIKTRNTTFISFLRRDAQLIQAATPSTGALVAAGNPLHGVMATITERQGSEDAGESFVKETVHSEDEEKDEDNVITSATFYEAQACDPCTFSRVNSETAITDFDKYSEDEYKVDLGAWEDSRWTISNLHGSPVGTLWFISSDYITTQHEIDALSGKRATFGKKLEGDFSNQSGTHGEMKGQVLSFIADFTDQTIERFKIRLDLGGVDTGRVEQDNDPVSFVHARHVGIDLQGESCTGCAGSSVISGAATVEFLGPSAETAMGSFTLHNQDRTNAFTGVYTVEQDD